MPVKRIVAVTALVLTCFAGVGAPAGATPGHVQACGHADRSLGKLRSRDQKLQAAISKLQTEIANAAAGNAATKLHRRLDRTETREHKLSAAITQIQSACAGH